MLPRTSCQRGGIEAGDCTVAAAQAIPAKPHDQPRRRPQSGRETQRRKHPRRRWCQPFFVTSSWRPGKPKAAHGSTAAQASVASSSRAADGYVRGGATNVGSHPWKTTASARPGQALTARRPRTNHDSLCEMHPRSVCQSLPLKTCGVKQCPGLTLSPQ